MYHHRSPAHPFLLTHFPLPNRCSGLTTSTSHALLFGAQKLNLHLSGHEFEPKARSVQPGSADLCFLTDADIDTVLASFRAAGLEVLEGGEVVERVGAMGRLRSVYVRDPDGNLIE